MTIPIMEDEERGRRLRAFLDDLYSKIMAGAAMDTYRVVDEATQVFAIGEAVEALKRLAFEDRLQVIEHFCSHCGRDQASAGFRGCQCWNDE